MAHRYGHPIEVALDAAGEPASLQWRGRQYRVLQIFSRWLLRERRREARQQRDAHVLEGLAVYREVLRMIQGTTE